MNTGSKLFSCFLKLILLYFDLFLKLLIYLLFHFRLLTSLQPSFLFLALILYFCNFLGNFFRMFYILNTTLQFFSFSSSLLLHFHNVCTLFLSLPFPSPNLYFTHFISFVNHFDSQPKFYKYEF